MQNYINATFYITTIIMVCLIVISFYTQPGRRNKLPIKKLWNEVLVHKDDGKHNVFVNVKYKVKANPDFIFTLDDGYAIVEYKSRRKGIYISDIIQGYIGALAASDKYKNIHTLFIYNKGNQVKEIKLPNPDRLFNIVKKDISIALNSKNGIQPKFQAVYHKCKACSLRGSCNKKVVFKR